MISAAPKAQNPKTPKPQNPVRDIYDVVNHVSLNDVKIRASEQIKVRLDKQLHNNHVSHYHL